MNDVQPVRVLVITDRDGASEEVLAAIRDRAAKGAAQFRVVVPNPAKAEFHLLHPQRHDKAAEAETVLRAALPAFEQAAGGHVIGTVSIRHDPYDAVEEVMLSEPVEEIIVSIAPHHLNRWLHLDLPHRLQHFHLPITTLGGQ
jgi:hypothetical protein